MKETQNILTNDCNFMSVKPIMMDLPYPPVQVSEENQVYANLLTMDYCGSVSETTAIMQYINNENCLSCKRCSIAKTILGIAMAEMIHLQKLGELICLLGSNIDFAAKPQNGSPRMWTPEYVRISGNARQMLLAGIESEKAAISQYRMHIRMINDRHINAVLARIIKDEEYHIMILQALMNEL